MPTKKRLMIDIETCSLEPHAAVWEIGYWEIGSDFNDTMGKTYFNGHFLMNPYDQHRTIDDDTLDWLSNNSDSWKAAQLVFSSLGDTKPYLVKFQKEVIEQGFDEIWCKGADFDFAVLRSLFRQYDISLPWHYRDQCCMRGFQNTFPEFEMKWSTGQAHSGMYDARSQAVVLENILKHLGRF